MKFEQSAVDASRSHCASDRHRNSKADLDDPRHYGYSHVPMHDLEQ